MKKRFWLGALVIAALFLGCGDDDDNGTGTGTGGIDANGTGTGDGTWPSTGTGPAEGKGKLADWKVEPGWENTYPAAEMTITQGTAPDGKTAMAVSWGSSKELRMCDLYAALPTGVDYGEYDGLVFEVWIDVCQMMMTALRNPPINSSGGSQAGTAWRVSETSYRYNAGWQIITAPLEAAIEPQDWGTIPAEQVALNQWLTANKNTEIILTLNPELYTEMVDMVEPPAEELPKGNAIDTTYTNWYKRIGFYKSSDPYDPDPDTAVVCWIWKF